MNLSLHIEFVEADGAEGMAAVDHDSGNVSDGIVVVLAEGAFVLVEQFADELVYLFSIKIGWVFGLFEEESGRVLQLFHLIQKHRYILDLVQEIK
jgi:hypothetical protein